MTDQRPRDPSGDTDHADAATGAGSAADANAVDMFTEALLDRAAGRSVEAALSDADRELLAAMGDWLPGLQSVLANHPLVRTADEPEVATPVNPTDPIAQMLGLVEDGSVVLDGRKVASQRRAAGLDLAQFVDRLQRRGWSVTVSVASAWERNRTNPPPAAINAIAEELGVPTDKLLAGTTPKGNDLDQIFDDQRIATFLDAWAQEADISVETLRLHSKRLFATAGKRNATTATPETVLAILRHFKNLPGFEAHE